MATEAQKTAKKKYREKGYRITVDFYPSEAALWEHLQDQPKKQTYIKDLIRADMEATMKSETQKQIGNYIDMMMKMEMEKGGS